MERLKHPFSRGLSIVAGILFLLGLFPSIISFVNAVSLSNRSSMSLLELTYRLDAMAYITTIAIWISLIVLVFALFMRSGLLAGIAFTSWIAVLLTEYIYHGLRGHGINLVFSLLMLASLMLLAIACYRRKMGIPMACVSMTLIYGVTLYDLFNSFAQLYYASIADYLLAAVGMATPVALFLCAYSLFTGSYLPAHKKA